ncbi:recombination-associated protein RdgC [Vibrio fluvialis]|nr:recombination-associated protein RdgC [Vibrio fluvialis]
MNFNPYKTAVVYSFKELPEPIKNRELLQQELAKRIHQPIAANAETSQGFTHPFFAENDERLFVEFDHYLHLAYIHQEKSVDKSTIDARVDEAVAKAAGEGRVLDQESKTALFDQFKSELLPFFNVKTTVTSAYIDFKRMVFVVNTSSTEVAEAMIRCLRTTLGSFPVQLIRLGFKPCQALSLLVSQEKCPDKLFFDEEGTLKAKNKPGPDFEKQSVNLQGFDVETESVRTILKNLNVIACDLWTTVQTPSGNFSLCFCLRSPADGLTKRNPDVILSGMKFGMAKRYFNEEVPSAVFECCTYIGIILDRIVNAFDGCEETNLLDGEFGVEETTAADIEKILEVKNQASTDIDDALFEQAKAFVIESRRASVSGLQRKFKIGFNRAALLMDSLAQMDIVSAPNGAGVREVLAPAEVTE